MTLRDILPLISSTRLVDMAIDQDRDQAYILLQPSIRDMRGMVIETIRVEGDILIDFDKDGKIVWTEFLCASYRLAEDLKNTLHEALVEDVERQAETLRRIRVLTGRKDAPAAILAEIKAELREL